MTRQRLVSVLGFAALSCGPLKNGHSAGFEQLWRTDLGGEYQASWSETPVLVGDLVLFGARGGVVGVDAKTGRIRWRAFLWRAANRAFGSLVERNGIACLADAPAIGCVDVRTGAVLWKRQPDASPQISKAAIDDYAWYFGTTAHRAYAIDPRTGRQLWVTDLRPNAPALSTVWGMTTSGDTAYATTVHWLTEKSLPLVGDLLALDRRTGKPLLRYETPGGRGGFMGAAIIAGRLAVMNDGYAHSLVAVDRFSGKEVWRTEKSDSGYINAESRPILVGDTLFAASSDTQVYAVDVHTGQILWRARSGVGSLGSIAVCSTKLLVVEYGGGFIAEIDRATHYGSRIRSVVREVRSNIAVRGDTAYFETIGGIAAHHC